METAEKVKLFQAKLDKFFESKALQKKITKESIKLIVSFRKDGTLRYEVWDWNNNFLGDEKIDGVIALNMLERAFTSYEKIESGLIEKMAAYGKQHLILPSEMALLIKPTHEYAVLKNRSKFNDILLNEIL